MIKEDIELKIISTLDKIRPFLINDGGNIEYIKYENHIVYVKLTGACANCSMMNITLKDGIEELLKNEIPEVNEVINVVETVDSNSK